jgi:hypothetical protein
MSSLPPRVRAPTSRVIANAQQSGRAVVQPNQRKEARIAGRAVVHAEQAAAVGGSDRAVFVLMLTLLLFPAQHAANVRAKYAPPNLPVLLSCLFSIRACSKRARELDAEPAESDLEEPAKR